MPAISPRRHRTALEVRTPSSQSIEIRGVNECPTCHRPFRSPSPERQLDSSGNREDYVDPEYFRMLRARNNHINGDRAPPSPVRRLVEPVRSSHIEDEPEQDLYHGPTEFVSSIPAAHEGSRIKEEAFSDHYFNTFFVEERELGRGGKGVVLLVRHQIDGCHLGMR